MQKSIHSFNHAIEKAHLWIKELQKIGDFSNEEDAYNVLRAVLHALRDRLVVGEAAQFGAQLPTLIRGMYYAGWDPGSPAKEHTQEEFLASIDENLRPAGSKFDLSRAARSVFRFLEAKISEGEIGDIKSELPPPILALWP